MMILNKILRFETGLTKTVAWCSPDGHGKRSKMDRLLKVFSKKII
jgi:hypothetical protein